MTLTTQEKIDYALMAGAVYISTRDEENRLPTPDGWQKLEYLHESDTETGFEAIAFRKGNQVVISFAGTYGSPLPPNPDGVANFWMGQGVYTSQLGQAAEYYLSLKNDPAYAGVEFTFTGHSLGGGLAALMGVFFDKAAVTFDPAPFRESATIEMRDTLIDIFVTAGYGIDPDLANFYSDEEVVVGPNIITNIRGEENITAIAVEGEVLSVSSDSLKIYNDLITLYHGTDDLSLAIELHSQALLIAFLEKNGVRLDLLTYCR